jgi:uncharacterized repeat protein (TIGR03803 family)
MVLISEQWVSCVSMLAFRDGLLMRSKRLFLERIALLAISAMSLVLTGTVAVAQQERVLHSFNNNGIDGYQPAAGLLADSAGNLYGTTYDGGSGGSGTVFELTPKTSGGWAERILYNFGESADHGDGANPSAALIFDTQGSLFGTTANGGDCSGECSGSGTVFELTRQQGGGWVEAVVYSFGAVYNAENPTSGLVLDASGNLWGTTSNGGDYYEGALYELIFESDGYWSEDLAYGFDIGQQAGNTPAAGLSLDPDGHLFGTTTSGGNVHGGDGEGSVFEFEDGATVIHYFDLFATDGHAPAASVIFDAAGNIYGTTVSGGAFGYGTVFELIRPSQTGQRWEEKILHNFNFNGRDGTSPSTSLVFDAAGNLYGTTPLGGAGPCPQGCGTVYELSTQLGSGGWTERIVHSFGVNSKDGANPLSNLVLDAAGNLYGTTSGGGAYGAGTVFQIAP